MSVSLHIPYGDGESNTVKFTENSLYGLTSNYYSGLQMKLIGYDGNYWYAFIDDEIYRVEFAKDSAGNPNITYTNTNESADCGIMLNDTLIFASIESTRRSYNLVIYTFNGSFTKLVSISDIGDGQQQVTNIVPMNSDNSLVYFKYMQKYSSRSYGCILDMSDFKNIKLVQSNPCRVDTTGVYLNENHNYYMDTRNNSSYGNEFYLYECRYTYSNKYGSSHVESMTQLLHLTYNNDGARGDGGIVPLIRTNRKDSICLPIIPTLSPFETPHNITNFTYMHGDEESDTITMNALACNQIDANSANVSTVDISLLKKPFPFLILTLGNYSQTAGGQFDISGTKIYILDTKSFSTGGDGVPVLDIVI